ncbi:MAG: hypothetical protein H0V67_09940 [Geodermatophilaceae bacterium]|nr:hypothetical protein [Geodermatophilaceae bacterium]
MTSTKDVDTLLFQHDLPLELRRPSGVNEYDETKVATRLSGMITGGQHDEVICPDLLRRNLVIPSNLHPVTSAQVARVDRNRRYNT